MSSKELERVYKIMVTWVRHLKMSNSVEKRQLTGLEKNCFWIETTNSIIQQLLTHVVSYTKWMYDTCKSSWEGNTNTNWNKWPNLGWTRWFLRFSCSSTHSNQLTTMLSRSRRWWRRKRRNNTLRIWGLRFTSQRATNLSLTNCTQWSMITRKHRF